MSVAHDEIPDLQEAATKDAEVRVRIRLDSEDPFGLHQQFRRLTPAKRSRFARELMVLGFLAFQKIPALAGAFAQTASVASGERGYTRATSASRQSTRKGVAPKPVSAQEARGAEDGSDAFATMFGSALRSAIGRSA